MKLRSPGRAHPPCSAARSLLAALCGALCLALAVPAEAQPAPAPSARIQRGSDANLLVLEIQLDGHVLSDTFTAYQDGSQVLLPLGELSRLLTLAITVSPMQGTASGFVIREDRTFELNVDDAVAGVRGRQKSFEPRLAAVIGDDIYVASALLAHWLPVDFDIDLARLQLNVRPRERLPLQERLEREDSAARLRSAANEPRDLGYPRVTSPYAMASLPFVDQTFSAEATRNDSSRHYQGDYTAYLTGDFLAMEGSAYVSTRTQKTILPSDDRTLTLNSVAGVIDDRSGSDVRLTLARHDPDAGLLGPMRARSVELGSFVLPSVPNVLLASPHGNGIMVSNRPLDQPTSFDRHTFRGNLPPGWDVTLYYNDALIGYQTARSDGQYAFEDLPLSFGPNEFRLVFNGPLGQVRVERQSFLLDQSVIAPGEYFYSLAQHRANSGDERTVAQIDYGITRALAVNAAFVRKPGLNGSEDSTYAQAGARGYLDSMILSALVTQQWGSGTLTELAVKTGLGGYALDFVHQQRQGSFESDSLVNASAGLRYRDKVRANGVTRIDALPPLTIAVEATRDANADGHDRIDLAGRVSTIYRGTAITNTLAWTRTDGADLTDGTLQVSRRVVDVGLTAQVGYGLAPRVELQSATLTADRALGTAYRLTAGLQRTMIAPLTTATLGLTKNLGAFGLGINGSYSSKHELTLGLQLFVAIGREPRSGAWLVDAQPLAATGAISARAFVDRNQNGIRDPGEELVGDAGFILNGGGRYPTRTDTNGTAFIGRLPPGQYTDIALDPATLEDPQWKPATPGLRILPRPGVVEVLEFPVVATSEIDGTVYLVGAGERRGIGDAHIELADADGRVVAATRSSPDGYYLLHQVLPGRYSLRIAPEQTEKLQLSGTLARPLTVPVDGDFINGQDFELHRGAR
jgi:hypothetical protein